MLKYFFASALLLYGAGDALADDNDFTAAKGDLQFCPSFRTQLQQAIGGTALSLAIMGVNPESTITCVIITAKVNTDVSSIIVNRGNCIGWIKTPRQEIYAVDKPAFDKAQIEINSTREKLRSLSQDQKMAAVRNNPSIVMFDAYKKLFGTTYDVPFSVSFGDKIELFTDKCNVIELTIAYSDEGGNMTSDILSWDN